jgi:DNA-binding PadR family transcriptional regulator
MSYAESINPGSLEGPAFTPPPWAMRHMHRMHKMRGRMMVAMAESGPIDNDDAGTDERSDGRPDERGRRGGHRGGHRHGPGPGPWGRGPWGPPRGRRRDRGDVRAAILLLLAERPRHGYEIITELTDRSEGRWQPSPGSIYPMLKRLSRDGLVSATPEDGKAVFSLTEDGRALVTAEGASWGEPWLRPEDVATAQADELWAEFRQLAMATTQVTQLDDASQIAAATAIVTEARKKIYGLLAQ